MSWSTIIDFDTDDANNQGKEIEYMVDFFRNTICFANVSSRYTERITIFKVHYNSELNSFRSLRDPQTERPTIPV